MVESNSSPVSQSDSGVLLRLQIQPRASRSEISGIVGEPPRLKIRIAAPPVDGEANEELIAFLGKTLGIAKSKIAIVRGHSGKIKDVHCAGVPFELAKERLSLK